MTEFKHNTTGRAEETGALMRLVVDRYYTDMAPYAHLSAAEVFDIVKSVPFRPDPEGEEVLMRPAYTMNMQGNGGDCDDKSIAFAAYCRLVGIPYRFVAVRRDDMPNLHHVFTEIYLNGRWIHADPTYDFNTLGREREQYAEYVLI